MPTLLTVAMLLLPTSPALALGFEFSPMWFLTAGDEEISSTLAAKSTMELCNVWKKASDNKGMAGDKARMSIGTALESRGENPFLCQQMGFGN